MSAGVSGAREDEGPLVRLQLAQAVVGGAAILHTQNIVDGAMVELRAVVEAVNVIERHGLVRALKHGRLVHIIPKSGDSHTHKVAIEAAPPVAHARKREIGKDARPRPHGPNVIGAVRIFHEGIDLFARIVRPIPGFFLQVQVGDRDSVKSLGAQIANHLLKRGESLAIDRERPVAVLIVDVQIDDVCGNLLIAEEPRDFPHARLGIVAVAALLKPERPERRQRHMPDHPRVLGENRFRLRPGVKVIIQLAALGAEREIVVRFLAEIETAAVGVVEEDAPGCAIVQPHNEGNRFVERVGGFLPAVGVCVPHCEGAIAAVHRPSLVAEAIIILAGRHALPNVDSRPVPSHRQRGFIGKECLPGGVEKTDQ